MKSLVTFWKFSRPHTVTGTFISIFTIYVILCGSQKSEYIPLLVMALITGIAGNIFIVGINQIADVHIDKINKPWLPIPSGELKIEKARLIVFLSLMVSLAFALYMTPVFFVLVFLSALVGWAYSMPPFHLKKHHLPAALAISLVRGVVVNVGGFLVFSHLMHSSMPMPKNLKVLTLFITAFGIVIAWFKDLPDVEGDSRFSVKTFPILYSPKTALIAGNLLLGSAYLFTIGVKYLDLSVSAYPLTETKILFFGHVVLFVLFAINSVSIRFNQARSVKLFYRRFWYFLFAEYLLYLLAYM